MNSSASCHPSSDEIPALSVLVVVGIQRGRARQTIAAIYQQTAAAQLELIVADTTPGAGDLGLSQESMSTTYLTCDPEKAWGAVRAAAVRAAKAPLVAFTEEHAMPREDWAEAILDFAERREPGAEWAAATYAFVNGNPTNYVARAGFISDYSEWAHPMPPGVKRLACNNIVYFRPALMNFGKALGRHFESDFVLCEKLRRGGYETTVIPEAVTFHLNPEEFGVLWSGNMAHCRLIGAGRAATQSWGWPRRLVYGLAVPLAVPLMRIYWVARVQVRRRALWMEHLRSMPLMLALYVGCGVAEGWGYLFGAGDASQRFQEMELSAERSQHFQTNEV